MERRLFARWLACCVIDYGLLGAATLIFALCWPGGREPLSAVMLIVLAQLLYQPLGELLGGTLGQRMAGIRLVAAAADPAVTVTTVIRRHGERIGVVWGLLSAYLYWRKHLGPQPGCAERPSEWEWTLRGL